MKADQSFNIKIDGIYKKAQLIDVINYQKERYAIYAIIQNDKTCQLYTSKVKRDENGFDEFVDKVSDEVNEYILNLIEAK